MTPVRQYAITKLSTYLDLCTQVYDLNKPTPPRKNWHIIETDQLAGHIVTVMGINL